jgi:hypothetical protein
VVVQEAEAAQEEAEAAQEEAEAVQEEECAEERELLSCHTNVFQVRYFNECLRFLIIFNFRNLSREREGRCLGHEEHCSWRFGLW